jgi:hypothetical protein
MPKKIGLKYCGGCNPRYDRVAMMDRIRVRLGRRCLFLRPDRSDLEGMVIVNGCPTECATRDLEEQGIPYHSVTEEDGVDEAAEWLKALPKEE